MKIYMTIGLAVAVLMALVAVASANKIGGRLSGRHSHNHIDDEEFEHEPHHLINRLGHHNRHHLNHLNNDELDGEWDGSDRHHNRHHNRHHLHHLDDDDEELGHHHHGHLGHQAHVKPLLHKLKHIKRGNVGRRGGRLGSGASLGAGAGLGAVGAAGAIGGLRGDESQAGEFEKDTKLANHKSIEGQRGAVGGSKKKFGAGINHHKSEEDEGIHKHQVLNKDKLIVKDRTTGVNDVDGFRHHSESSDGAHIGGSKSKFFGAGESGSAQSDNEFEEDIGNRFGSQKSIEAGGAIGGVKGAGAIGGFGASD